MRICKLSTAFTHVKSLADIDFGKFRNPIPFLERGLPRISNINFPQLQNVQNLVCDTCMDVSTLIEQVLTDPDTVNSALEFVDVSLCQNIPHLQQQCQNLASTYVPDLMETLQVYAAPNKLCGETKLCPSSAVLRLNDARACKMCTEFAEEALVYVQDSKTETEILDALHVQCAKLGDFESQCNMLVDVYGPLYISKLDSLTPDQVCQKARMCNAPSIRDPASCATCQFAVLQMKAKLQNPAVQEKMMQALIDQCNKVPAHTTQCKELLTQYGPFIFAHLDTYMNPETICAEIHACESKKKKTEDMVQLSFAADMEPAVHSS
ncbi:hypothetical protein KP509_28G021800 [Ceratopteris richardii]|uniref:Saposin B-type domain-containing protein n=1 Tax=Ceratopteris richardii TaxID=49495 RepID=A0A8T2RBW2_CERRI|nr:hypothetical protein KP509_28G021800 [Ceratopteris richardii]